MIPIEAIPFEAAPTPRLLAGAIGWFGMLVGAYIVFACERSDIPLIFYGLISSLFGVCIYATVRMPGWLPEFFTQHTLVSVSLVLILGMALHLTYLVWQYYDLKPPWVRTLEIARTAIDRLTP